MRRSNQLSCEAINVESWSIMCSCAPVKEMNATDVYDINRITSAQMKADKE